MRIDATYLGQIVNHMTMDLCNAGNPREVTPKACRELLLDMIYDDFSVRTRVSRLQGQDRMQGATGPRTIQGGTLVNPPIAPIYGPDLSIDQGYGGSS